MTTAVKSEDSSAILLAAGQSSVTNHLEREERERERGGRRERERERENKTTKAITNITKIKQSKGLWLNIRYTRSAGVGILLIISAERDIATHTHTLLTNLLLLFVGAGWRIEMVEK